MPPRTQIATMAVRSSRMLLSSLAFLSWTALLLRAQPADLAKRVAARETQAMEARLQYTYKQTVLIEEMASKSGRPGEYREVREVIFSPSTGERTEQMVGKPVSNLARLRLTDEDFRDIRDVQPFLFTADQLWLYETKPRGEETADGVDCWLLQVRPRQVHQGQRLFDGIFWVDKRDLSGQSLPAPMRWRVCGVRQRPWRGDSTVDRESAVRDYCREACGGSFPRHAAQLEAPG